MAKDRIAKMQEMFPDTGEPEKKYPPIEDPLPTEPPHKPDPGLLADLVAQNNTGLKFSETTTDIQKPIPMRRRLDPELKAMDEVCEILEPFPPEVKMRILNWAINKFFPANTANKVPPNGTRVDEDRP